MKWSFWVDGIFGKFCAQTCYDFSQWRSTTFDQNFSICHPKFCLNSSISRKLNTLIFLWFSCRFLWIWFIFCVTSKLNGFWCYVFVCFSGCVTSIWWLFKTNIIGWYKRLLYIITWPRTMGNFMNQNLMVFSNQLYRIIHQFLKCLWIKIVVEPILMILMQKMFLNKVLLIKTIRYGQWVS